MLTRVDIDDSHIATLDALAQAKGLSRAALVQKAVSDYLKKEMTQKPLDAFGLWAESTVDGLIHQDQMRKEW